MTASKAKAAAQQAEQAETVQDEPTAPRPRDENGFELDEWGLPIAGPIRAAKLAELNLPDPLDDPKAWKKAAKQGGDTETELTQEPQNV